VLKEVEQLLAEGRAVGSKQLTEYMEVKGYADAAQWIYGQAIHPEAFAPDRIISMDEVRGVHQRAMQPVWDVKPHPDAHGDEGPGQFRRHDIHPFPGGMVPPAWPLVHGEMDLWVKQAATLQARAPGFPERIAELHCRFEQIHPYIDGNGRTGRLILNILLVRLGYPPAIIYKNQRTAYLSALRRADKGEPGALGGLIARAVLDNLYKFVVPAVAGPARLVPLAALATRELNGGALRAAAVRGALEATKGPDGQWRSCRNWVEEYIRTRHRRR
jgi:hypothetical protein